MTAGHTGREQLLPDPLFNPRLCAEAILSAIDDPQREIRVGRSTLRMAMAQALAPGFADRQASGFAEQKLGDHTGSKQGNLDATDRAISNRREYFTSRQRDLLKIGIGGGIAGLGALAGFGIARLPSRPST